MDIVFTEDCAADDCYQKNVGNGKQMCELHEKMYEDGIPFKGFYGKTVLRKEFQNKQIKNSHDNNR